MRFAALDGRRLLSAQSAQAGGQADACIVRHLGRCSVGVCVGVRVPLCRAVCPGVGVAGQNAACGVGGVFGGIADGAGGIPGSIAQILSGIAQIASGVVCHVLAHIALVVGGRAVAVQLTIFIGVGAGGVLGAVCVDAAPQAVMDRAIRPARTPALSFVVAFIRFLSLLCRSKKLKRFVH